MKIELHGRHFVLNVHVRGETVTLEQLVQFIRKQLLSLIIN